MNQDNLPQFTTVEGVAKMLNVGKSTILRYIKDKDLPHVYLSDQTIRIPIEQLEIWIKEQKGSTSNSSEENSDNGIPKVTKQEV